MAQRHEKARNTPKNHITDAHASFREELRLMKERIVHLETIVDKIGDLEEKIEGIAEVDAGFWGGGCEVILEGHACHG